MKKNKRINLNGIYKCPNCKKMSLVVDLYDCPGCGGIEIFFCENCNRDFDIKTKEEL